MSTTAPVLSLKRGECLFLEVALPGRPPENAGVLLLDPETDQLYLQFRRDWEHFAPEEADVLSELESDLDRKAREMGGRGLLESLEDRLSNILRVTEREAVQLADFPARLRRLYREHVQPKVLSFRTHLPLTTCAAAAGGLSEEMTAGDSGDWLEVGGRRLTPDMFVARVEGRSMEPRIPDGSLCVFRLNPVGSRDGRLLLIEKFGEIEGSARFTIKRYRSRKVASEEGGWRHEEVRLEPLNPEFEPWTLAPDQFRVVAEFVDVLPPEE